MPKLRRQFQAHGAHGAAGIDGAGHDGSQDASGHIIGMAFQARGFIQNARRAPAQTQQAVGDDHAGGERGGARSQAFAEGNLIIDRQLDGRQLHAHVGRDGERRLPDEVVSRRWKWRRHRVP
jgi:hypothetical protein